MVSAVGKSIGFSAKVSTYEVSLPYWLPQSNNKMQSKYITRSFHLSPFHQAVTPLIIHPLLHSKASSRKGRRGFGLGHPTSKKISYPPIHHDEDDDDQYINSQTLQDDLENQLNTHIEIPIANHNNNNNINAGARVSEFLSNIPKVLSRPPLVSSTQEWRKLQRHAAQTIKSTHLRELLQDPVRCDAMFAEHDGVYLDYSRQRVTLETMDLLFDLAEKQELTKRIQSMVNGEKINFTEDRAVLHTALRASKDKVGTVFVDDVDAIKEVHEVLDQIKQFTEAFRSGHITGYTGKRMRNIVSVGIGGSYLGPEFLHEVSYMKKCVFLLFVCVCLCARSCASFLPHNRSSKLKKRVSALRWGTV
jgi:hypothetical protein